ncbi:MAG: hybrid sensor histidine kinase/response regulator, partial [Nostoc sp.]
MPNFDKIHDELTNELAVMRQRVAELEQSEISYQQRQAALEEQLTELETKLAIAAENPQIQVVEYDMEYHLEQGRSTALMPNHSKEYAHLLERERTARKEAEIANKIKNEF